MRAFTLAFCLLPILAFCQDISANADSLLSAYHHNDQFSGTVFIAKNGKVIFEKGYGQADRAHHIPNTAGTEYRIGSVTKPFTAALFMKLQENGILSINDPVSKFIPAYPNGDSILLKNLLNHTSGIKSLTSMKAYYSEWIGQQASLATTVSRFQNEPMSFSPGEKFEYSNSNYILLSYVAELATQTSFEKLLNQYVFKPLQMHHSGLDKNDRQSKFRALGYQASPGNDFAPARFNDMSIMMGAGSMYSTARDLYAFDRALKGDTFLSAKSKYQLYTVFKNNYALGWEIDTVNRRIQVSHSGSIDGFLSNMIRYPEEDVCIIFLSNYFNSKGPQISKALVSIAFEEAFTLPQKRDFVHLSIDDLKPYEGLYQMEKGPSLKVFIEEGKIKGQLEGQSPFLMLPESKEQFYIKVIDTDVVWTRNEKQQVVVMVLKQGKKEMKFSREMKDLP